MTKKNELPFGSIVGILGGGQLGRMLSLSASQLGFKTHIYDPDIDAPAKQVTNLSSTFEYDDIKNLEETAKNCKTKASIKMMDVTNKTLVKKTVNQIGKIPFYQSRTVETFEDKVRRIKQRIDDAGNSNDCDSRGTAVQWDWIVSHGLLTAYAYFVLTSISYGGYIFYLVFDPLDDTPECNWDVDTSQTQVCI